MVLKKELGAFEIFAIASGAMISSGLFILPGIAFAKTGPAVVFAYILAGILVIPTVLAKAELATAMPKAGGTYFFIERSMGAAPGTISGIAAWFSLSFKSAFALVGIGAFAILINPNITIFEIKIIAVACCLFFVAVNLLGAQIAGRFQVTMVMLLIGLIVLYILRGSLSINIHRYTPFAPFGATSIVATAGLVFVSYGGLTKIASVAEEVRNPGRNIPLGMFLAFAIVSLLYATAIFITVGLVDPSQLGASLTPISLGAAQFWGMTGGIVMSIAALFAFVSTANAGILAASRGPMAMSRDELLPRFFSRVNKRYKTPHYSILFTGGFMIMVILFLGLENLIKAASTMKILIFIFVNLALIIMRESKIQNYQPKFKAPLYPWLQIAGVIGYIVLIAGMGRTTLLTLVVFICCTLLFYVLYVRPKISREYALMYIVERITDKQIVTETLTDELREIVKERDEIVEDEFDRLAGNALILDFDEKMHFDEFIKIAAEKLGRRIDVEQDKLIQLFIEREKQSCTALRPGLAIPHIIIDGERKFDIMMVRAKQGITFPDAPEPVHIVFVLIGTRDMRNLHLRALMAIAQITEQPGFDTNWLSARTIGSLRDIVLLGKRKRT